MLINEELKQYNTTYNFGFNHGEVTEDLKIVNDILDGLNHIDRKTPQIGDIAVLKSGDKKVRCHLESLITGHGGNLCQNCNYSFISNWRSDSDYFCMTSGGPWAEANPGDFTYLGTTTRWFWTWGRHGVGPGNGICFPATVSMWEVEVDNAYIPHPQGESI